MNLLARLLRDLANMKLGNETNLTETKLSNVANACKKSLRDICEVQRVCDCATTRVTFGRSISATRKIIRILTGDEYSVFECRASALRDQIDAHDALVLFSHYLRCVWNCVYPLIENQDFDHLSEDDFHEIVNQANIIRLDCENACFRASHTPPAAIM